jgi:hypothetical protein
MDFFVGGFLVRFLVLARLLKKDKPPEEFDPLTAEERAEMNALPAEARGKWLAARDERNANQRWQKTLRAHELPKSASSRPAKP